jgi:signal transduction histidine kinase
MIPNSDENLESIKSIIIIPISMLNKNFGFFLANTPLSPDEIDISKSQNIQNNFQVAFSTISIINSSKEKENSLLEYKILREQVLLASNQIASSEIVVTLNNAFELPLKVIKTNIELLQKGVGDTKRRLEIISEQFANLADTSNLMKELGNYIEYTPYKHNLLDVVNQSLNILSSYISKNGIILKTNFDDKAFMIKNETVMGYRRQLIFALMNIMLHSISTMPDGGSIHIGLYKNENAVRSNSTRNINTPSTISIIISDNGTGVDSPDVNGELISLADLSEKKMKTKFLFLLSQHIIMQHRGKFSIYSESGKGTTFKITIPIE